MSGSIGTLTTLAAGTPLAGLANLAASQLSIASWRGVPFYLLSDDSEAGQRVVKFMFAGRAEADFRWLGAVDGDMRIEGLLIGADSVRQAARMRAACQAAGPGKLVHPWWGPFDAVLTERAHFVVSEREGGIVHFTGTWQRYAPPAPATPSFFSALQDAADELMGAARELLGDVFGVLDGPLAAYAFVSGMLSAAAGVWGALGIGSGGTAAASAVADQVADLLAAAPVPGPTYAGTVDDLLAAPAVALAGAATPQGSALIGPGPVADASTADVDPAIAAPALLDVSAALGASMAGSHATTPVLAAVLLAVQMQPVAQAAAVGATVDWAAGADAQAWGAQLDAAIGGLQAQAAGLSAALPLSAGRCWRALAALRTAAAADVARRVVDLPGLLTVTTDRTQNAWRIALALYGDTPELVAGAVVDLWRRNVDALPYGNPAVVPPGTYTVLADG